MTTINLFNGKAYLSNVVKNGSGFDIKLAFSDATGYWKGTDVKVGDVVFCRGGDGKGYRLVITAFAEKIVSRIRCTVVPDTPMRFVPAQFCAVMRETQNHQYPQFPAGLPKEISAILHNYFAWKVDQDTQSGDCKSTITAAELDGTEFIPIIKNGESRCLPISEAIEYWLTLTSPNGTRKRLTLTDYAQTEWENRPPQ